MTGKITNIFPAEKSKYEEIEELPLSKKHIKICEEEFLVAIITTDSETGRILSLGYFSESYKTNNETRRQFIGVMKQLIGFTLPDCKVKLIDF